LEHLTMRASASPIFTPPEDVRLLSLTATAAALGTTERTAKELLAEAGVPIVRLGARTNGVRLSDVRRLLEAREAR
jgi:hypothetical protein